MRVYLGHDIHGFETLLERAVRMKCAIPYGCNNGLILTDLLCGTEKVGTFSGRSLDIHVRDLVPARVPDRLRSP